MKANETEYKPLSVDEMRELISRLGPITGLEYARAIATAVALEEAVAAMERVTNWILVHERAAGVKVIPALKTVREVFADPVDYYDGNACMEACRLACRGRSGIEAHLVASAIQYLWRSGRKGPALTDLLKAEDMIKRLVREIGGGK